MLTSLKSAHCICNYRKNPFYLFFHLNDGTIREIKEMRDIEMKKDIEKTEEHLKNVINEAFAEIPTEDEIKKAVSDGFKEHGTLTTDGLKKMVKKSERQMIMAIVGTGIVTVIGIVIVLSLLT